MPVEGQWWLPNSPDRTRFGHIEEDDGGSWVLMVRGGIAEPPSPQQHGSYRIGRERGTTHDVIHGRTVEGKTMSLFDCRGAGTWWPVEPNQEVWRFDTMVEGHEVVAADQPFGVVWCRLDGLFEWIGSPPPETSHAPDEVYVKSKVEELGAADLDGITVSLVADHSWYLGSSEIRINRDARIRVSVPAGITFREALSEFVLPLRDLFTFLALGFVEVQEVAGRLLGENTRHTPTFRYFAALQRPHRSPGPVRYHEMLAPAASIGISWSELVPAWFRLQNRYQSTVNLLLLPERAPYLYADDKLLTAVLALEAYHDKAIGGTADPPDDHRARVDSIVAAAPQEHRAWAERMLRDKNRKGLKRRLEEVLVRSGPTGEQLVTAVPNLVDLVVKSRNRVAHPARLDPDHGLRFVAGGMALRWVLRHCLLADLGLRADHVGELIGKSHAFENDLWLLRRWVADGDLAASKR